MSEADNVPDGAGYPCRAEERLMVVVYADDLDRLRAEIERLRAALRKSADILERQAFDIPPPNPHTPDLVMLANDMRRIAYDGHEQ